MMIQGQGQGPGAEARTHKGCVPACPCECARGRPCVYTRVRARRRARVHACVRVAQRSKRRASVRRGGVRENDAQKTQIRSFEGGQCCDPCTFWFWNTKNTLTLRNRRQRAYGKEGAGSRAGVDYPDMHNKMDMQIPNTTKISFFVEINSKNCLL